MQNKIFQGTPEWLEARQKKIGGSEIFTLVHHYCWQELKDMGFDLNKERPFRTIQELFLKIKFDAKLSEIDEVFSEFGKGMEYYVAYLLGQELPDLAIYQLKDFTTNEELHPLAACSPDGYAKCHTKIQNFSLPDFDKTCLIDEKWGRGAIELKTANYFANFGAETGAKLQYIFQLIYQMMVMDLKWGILAVLVPKEKKFDEPFFKGQILEKVRSIFALHHLNLSEIYDLYYYVHPRLPVFEKLIIKALNAFQSDLEAYDTDQSRFPRNSEDKAGLEREKALWGQLWPEHFGKKELEADDDLNKQLNERYQAQIEFMFAEQNFRKVENEIFQKVKSLGFDKYTEILGIENRMTWIKNGQIRFYKNMR